MKAYVIDNKQFYFILLFWMLLGNFGNLNYFIVPLTVILMLQKRMIEEVFMGFFFILIISDSFSPALAFAKNTKNIYTLILVIYFLFKTDEFYPLNNLYKLFFLFFMFSLFTIIMSLNEPFFVVGFPKTISYFFTFLIIPNFLDKLYRENGTEFLKRFMFFCLITLLVGFILKFIAPQIAYLSTGRYRGIMGNPNGIGIYSFLIFIVFSVINESFPKLFSKAEKILFYSAILLSLLMSESRSALFAVLIFFVCRKAFAVNLFFGFISFASLSFVAYFINLNIIHIIGMFGLSEYLRQDTLQDASGRYIAWSFAWQQIQSSFFIGKGWNYNEYYMHQNFEKLSELGHQGGVHNSFLSFWMDQGLIGLIIYLRSFILIFIKAGKKTRIAFPIMFAIFFTAIFESWLVASLSAYAFLGLFIFSILTSETINSKQEAEMQLA